MKDLVSKLFLHTKHLPSTLAITNSTASKLTGSIINRLKISLMSIKICFKLKSLYQWTLNRLKPEFFKLLVNRPCKINELKQTLNKLIECHLNP